MRTDNTPEVSELDPDLSVKLYISGHYLMATYNSKVKAIALLTDEDLKGLRVQP